jgi:inosine/xanthosine triphosphate pyrophosphatase family protein
MSKDDLKNFVLVTTNKNKLSEINQILGTTHKLSKIEIPEIQSLNLDQVINEKARAAYEKI